MMTCSKDELSHDPSCLPFCFSLFYTLVSPDTLLFSGTLLVVVICFACSLSLCCPVLRSCVTLCFFLSHPLPIVLYSVLLSLSASCHTLFSFPCALSLCHTLLLLTPTTHCLVFCPCVTHCFLLSHPLPIVLRSVLVSHSASCCHTLFPLS